MIICHSVPWHRPVRRELLTCVADSVKQRTICTSRFWTKTVRSAVLFCDAASYGSLCGFYVQ